MCRALAKPEERMHSDNELKLLSKKAYENSCELLEEAIILLNAKRYSRAYVLAHLASEELAKLPIIYGTRVRLYEKETIDWKNFKKRLTNHQPKLRAIALFDYMSDEVDLVNNEDVKRYNRQLEFIKNHDLVKNLGLYSGYHENVVYKPSEQFSAENAEAMINLTKGRILCLKEKWAGMIEGNITASKFPIHKILQEFINRKSS
jgi:AbiV family abortive infection protein